MIRFARLHLFKQARYIVADGGKQLFKLLYASVGSGIWVHATE